MPEQLAEIKIHCLVDGCPWVMTTDYEIREDGESVIDLHLNEHKIDELQNAARNGMLFAFCNDPLQTETTVVYVRAFLEWVRHQNQLNRENPIEGGTKYDDQIRIPLEPTDEDIFNLVDSFIELDYRFGN